MYASPFYHEIIHPHVSSLFMDFHVFATSSFRYCPLQALNDTNEGQDMIYDQGILYI